MFARLYVDSAILSRPAGRAKAVVVQYRDHNKINLYLNITDYGG